MQKDGQNERYFANKVHKVLSFVEKEVYLQAESIRIVLYMKVKKPFIEVIDKLTDMIKNMDEEERQMISGKQSVESMVNDSFYYYKYPVLEILRQPDFMKIRRAIGYPEDDLGLSDEM